MRSRGAFLKAMVAIVVFAASSLLFLQKLALRNDLERPFQPVMRSQVPGGDPNVVLGCSKETRNAPSSFLQAIERNPPKNVVPFLDVSHCEWNERKEHEFDLERDVFEKPVQYSMMHEVICDLKCSAREPELENVFRKFAITKYNLHGLLRLCEAQDFPFLVWIRGNQVLRRTCQDEPTGKRVTKDAVDFLAMLSMHFPLPNVIFGFDGNDYAIPQKPSPLTFSSSGWMHLMPLVVRFVGVESSPAPLFPTPVILKWNGFFGKSFSRRKNSYLEEEDWLAKSPTIYWRGGTTGIPFDYDFVYMMPRPELVHRFKDERGFDVGITALDGVSKKMKSDGFMHKTRYVDYAQWQEFANFKFHLHVDGNTASWALIKKLSSGFVVLWQKSPVTFREFFYELLKPWEHFIPVEHDFSNLLAIRDWLATSEGEKEASNIRRNQIKLLQSRLRPEDTICYVLRLLYSISELEDFNAGDERVINRAGSEFNIFAKDFDQV